MKAIRMLGMTVLMLAAAEAWAGTKGDAVRGEKVHEVCLDCHGTGLYASQERRIKSLSSLRREVARWGDYYNPALSRQDVEDVVAYLNSKFYKF